MFCINYTLSILVSARDYYSSLVATSGTYNACKMAIIMFHVSIYMVCLYSALSSSGLCNAVCDRGLEREVSAVCDFSLVGRVFHWRHTVALVLLAYSHPSGWKNDAMDN